MDGSARIGCAAVDVVQGELLRQCRERSTLRACEGGVLPPNGAYVDIDTLETALNGLPFAITSVLSNRSCSRPAILASPARMSIDTTARDAGPLRGEGDRFSRNGTVVSGSGAVP
jgi:hypothetical protein